MAGNLKPKQKASLVKDKPSSVGRTGLSDSPVPAFNFRDIILVLVVAWAARLAFMSFIPPEARSCDSYSWESVAKILEAGGNPYQATTFLNWPPLWMQLIYVLSKVAVFFGLPFFRVLQIFLILVETGVAVLLVRLIKEVVPTAPVRRLVIVGLALNPAAILLVCQHCNFDVIVALWLMLFMNSLLRYNRNGEQACWLAACLFLGMAILTKTVPFVLMPLLAGGFRQLAGIVKFLGFVLLLGPVTLGMSVIYVLAPADVTAKVLAYRSAGGYFGISGLLHWEWADRFAGLPSIFFYVLLVVVMALSWNLFWRRGCLGARETVLYAALLLAAVPSLGPGYAPQYLYWFLPFLIATFAFYQGGWRIVLGAFGGISACTYLVEYGLFPSHGTYLLYVLAHAQHMNQVASLLPVAQAWSSQTGQTLVRLPIFIAYLTLLAVGTRLFLRSIRDQAATGTSPGKKN